jgi:hypothetical protein
MEGWNGGREERWRGDANGVSRMRERDLLRMAAKGEDDPEYGRCKQYSEFLGS